jgi:staphylococcal nuclease domain-containing protein 1
MCSLLELVRVRKTQVVFGHANLPFFVLLSNVAVELVDQGYASAQEHRAGEPRTRDYEDVLFAEQRAQKANKGLHTKNLDKAPVVHINDLSTDDTKAKQFFPFLKRLGRARGVIEHIFSAGKLKIYVPKESAQIVLILSGISAPRLVPPPPEPFGPEALAFANDKGLQRDVCLILFLLLCLQG